MAGSDGIKVLDQGVGYGIVVGIGAFFAILMSVNRLGHENVNTNQYSQACYYVLTE